MQIIQPIMYSALLNNRLEPTEEMGDIPVGVEVFPDSYVDSVIGPDADHDAIADHVKLLLSQEVNDNNIKNLWKIRSFYYEKPIDERNSFLIAILLRIEDEVCPELLAILLDALGSGVISTYTDYPSYFDFSEHKLNLLRGFLQEEIKPVRSTLELMMMKKNSGYRSGEGIRV